MYNTFQTTTNNDLLRKCSSKLNSVSKAQSLGLQTHTYMLSVNYCLYHNFIQYALLLKHRAIHNNMY